MRLIKKSHKKVIVQETITYKIKFWGTYTFRIRNGRIVLHNDEELADYQFVMRYFSEQRDGKPIREVLRTYELDVPDEVLCDCGEIIAAVPDYPNGDTSTCPKCKKIFRIGGLDYES